MTTPATAALRRLADWRPQAAVVFGSGLAALPQDAVLVDELPYDSLGWPAPSVPGHGSVVQLVRVPGGPGEGLRLALACGRVHAYEGWSAERLEAAVRSLAGLGVRRLVLANSCGDLRAEPGSGDVVVCEEVVDLQAPPATEEPPRLPVCPRLACERVADAMRGSWRVRTGRYVSVCGPQFETPAEVAWLRGHGDVVGMSAVPEVRAARATGVECCLLALVANVAAAAGSHGDVLAASGRLGERLAAVLTEVVLARWPDLGPGASEGG